MYEKPIRGHVEHSTTDRVLFLVTSAILARFFFSTLEGTFSEIPLANTVKKNALKALMQSDSKLNQHRAHVEL